MKKIAFILPQLSFIPYYFYALHKNQICFINFSLWKEYIDFQLKTFWPDIIISSYKLEKKVCIKDLVNNYPDIIRLDNIIWFTRIMWLSLVWYFQIIFKQNISSFLWSYVYLFTSWSTWKPKLCKLSINKIKENIKWWIIYVQPKDYHNILCALPFFHSFGLNIWLIFPIIQKLWLIKSKLNFYYFYKITNWYLFAKYILKKQIHYLPTTPFFLKVLLLIDHTHRLQSLQSVYVWWDFSPDKIIQKFSKILPHVKYQKWYGMTECFPIIAINPTDNINHNTDGKILSYIDYKILNNNWKIIIVWEGILLIHIQHTIWKYENVDYFDAIDIDGETYFNTHDYVFIDNKWYISILARDKRIIKKWGELLNLEYLQNNLSHMYDGICVWKGENIYFITKKPIDIFDINIYLIENLWSLYKIKEIIVVDRIPMIWIWKIDYSTLYNQLP
jgi:hypothetical protein